ncbi:hypothetical protein L6R21_00085 [bacterium]|nr:hypothetical protein [bacterium]
MRAFVTDHIQNSARILTEPLAADEGYFQIGGRQAGCLRQRGASNQQTEKENDKAARDRESIGFHINLRLSEMSCRNPALTTAQQACAGGRLTAMFLLHEPGKYFAHFINKSLRCTANSPACSR